MNTTKPNQLQLDSSLFEQPDASKGQKKTAERKPRPAEKQTPVPAVQAFLPGLSRRGRPRKKDSLSPVARASESRKRRMSAGVKRIEVLLEPEVAAMLESLMAHHQASRVEILSRLISKAAKRLPSKEVGRSG